MTALALVLLLQSPLIYPDKPAPQWLAEKRGDALVVRRKAQEPVAYGFTKPYSSDLVVSCLPDLKALDVFIHVGVKPDEPGFLVRFDADAPLQVTGTRSFVDSQWRRAWGPSTADGMLELRPTPGERTPFLAQLLSHRSLRIRFVTGVQRETTFDLTGLGEAIGPLEEACGLQDTLAAAHAAAAAAVGPVTAAPATATPGADGKPTAKSPPSERRVGSWTVIEKTSTFDDAPIVVLANTEPTKALVLVLRCQERVAEAYVKAGFVLEPTDKTAKFVPLPYGFDGQPPKDFTGSASQDLTGVFFPDGKAFIRELRTHRTMAVRHQRAGATRALSAIFDLRGLPEALEPFVKGCPLD
jgi:hypothetical protein